MNSVPALVMSAASVAAGPGGEQVLPRLGITLCQLGFSNLRLSVDDHLSINDMVRRCKFGWVNPNICSRVFKHCEHGRNGISPQFLSCEEHPRVLALDVARDEFDCRLGDIEELLTLIGLYPSLMDRYRIFSFGSLAVIGDRTYVPWAGWSNNRGTRVLDLLSMADLRFGKSDLALVFPT